MPIRVPKCVSLLAPTYILDRSSIQQLYNPYTYTQVIIYTQVITSHVFPVLNVYILAVVNITSSKFLNSTVCYLVNLISAIFCNSHYLK